jgi:cytochrome c peroxidase
MFPVTSRDEMRGRVGDLDIFDEINELALIADNNLAGVWSAITARLLTIPEYETLFANAFSGIDLGSIGYEHAATAIAAFEIEAYTFTDTPWDQYLAGDDDAFSKNQKRGALLFYGAANCSSCHTGSLLTDQQHYNIGVPQLGPEAGSVTLFL